MTIGETRDPDTDARLTEHRLDPQLERTSEPGDETPRGTIGRGTLSVEARRTASALDDSSAQVAGPVLGHVPLPNPFASPVAYALAGNAPASAAVIDAAMPNLSMQRGLLPAEPLSSRELVSDQPTLVAIGGSGTMSLDSFRRVRHESYAAPSEASMRFMETGLALVAIAVALLLNLGR